MRSSKVVLENLICHSKDSNYQYERIYRILFNENLFLTAYSNIYSKPGNMTPGSDNATIDGFSLSKIRKTIASLKDCSYHPKPVRRVYIPKKNGKKRPLGVPSFQDKLVQEVVRVILECIYEGSFQDTSHGFRPNRSCHTALRSIKTTFTGVKWFVEGDIESFFDNIHHRTLIDILRKRIKDERCINLIEKFLNAGYMEDWKFNKTYSGAPQGSLSSPIISNIYLHELDTYMAEYKKIFDKGKRRTRTSEYRKMSSKLYYQRKKMRNLWNTLSLDEQADYKKQVRELEKECKTIEPTAPFDTSYRRIQYIRYCDDFLIGVIGSKADAERVKLDLAVFLKEKLHLNLSEEKTLITNGGKKAKFLGYEIKVKRSSKISHRPDGSTQRAQSLTPELYLPEHFLKDRILKEKLGAVSRKTGCLKPIAKPELSYNDDLEILLTYNAKIRGLYEFYQLAVNVCELNRYAYFVKFSMIKTFANKYKSSVRKICRKYYADGEFRVRYETKSGLKTAMFYHDGFTRNLKGSKVDCDVMEMVEKYSGRTSMAKRLSGSTCEWCGAEGVEIEIHHVRKLKNLSGKKKWEKQMIARKRKTMALCHTCHTDLHNGRLD